MSKNPLKDELIGALSKIYFMDAFNQLTDFLQGELKLLYFLLENDNEKISPSDLSDKLSISRPRITASLSTLKRKKLIKTQASHRDRRRLYVSLTDEGRAYVGGKKEEMDAYFEKYTELLGEKNITELIRIINLTLDLMGQEDFKGDQL